MTTGSWGRLLLSVAVASLVSLLLYSSVFLGRTQSIDALLYTQSLQAAFEGSRGAEAQGRLPWQVHGHWHLYLLSPLVAVFHPALILIAAQSVSLGITAWLSFRGLEIRGAILMTIGILLSPIVMNTFLFDLRPGLVAVPLYLAALVRMHELRDVDKWAMMLLLGACLCREEFCLVAGVSVLIFSAKPWQVRAGLAAIFLAYFSAYLTCRYWLTPTGTVESSLVLHSTGTLWSLDALEHKVVLAVSWLLAFGGVWLLAERRLVLLCVAGLLPAFVSTWMLDSQVIFHYAMFGIAPMVFAATTALNAALRAKLSLFGKLPFAAALILGFLFFSVLPGGGSYRPGYFNVGGLEERPLKVHKHLAKLPPETPAVVPFEYAAPLGNRISTQSSYGWRRTGAKISVPAQTFVIPERELENTIPYLEARGFEITKSGSGVVFLQTRNAAQK